MKYPKLSIINVKSSLFIHKKDTREHIRYFHPNYLEIIWVIIHDEFNELS